MTHYKLFHSDTEILGGVILDFGRALDAHRFLPILEKHGLSALEPHRWYPAQLWLDALNEIMEIPGAMFDLVSIGMQQMELVSWPPEFTRMSLSEILANLNDVYLQYYRGTDVGGIRAELIEPRYIQVTVRTFEPDDLWYGNLYGLVRRFLPNGNFIVSFDPRQSQREEGGDTTIFHIKWD